VVVDEVRGAGIPGASVLIYKQEAVLEARPLVAVSGRGRIAVPFAFRLPIPSPAYDAGAIVPDFVGITGADGVCALDLEPGQLDAVVVIQAPGVSMCGMLRRVRTDSVTVIGIAEGGEVSGRLLPQDPASPVSPPLFLCDLSGRRYWMAEMGADHRWAVRGVSGDVLPFLDETRGARLVEPVPVVSAVAGEQDAGELRFEEVEFVEVVDARTGECIVEVRQTLIAKENSLLLTASTQAHAGRHALVQPSRWLRRHYAVVVSAAGYRSQVLLPGQEAGVMALGDGLDPLLTVEVLRSGEAVPCRFEAWPLVFQQGAAGMPVGLPAWSAGESARPSSRVFPGEHVVQVWAGDLLFNDRVVVESDTTVTFGDESGGMLQIECPDASQLARVYVRDAAGYERALRWPAERESVVFGGISTGEVLCVAEWRSDLGDSSAAVAVVNGRTSRLLLRAPQESRRAVGPWRVVDATGAVRDDVEMAPTPVGPWVAADPQGSFALDPGGNQVCVRTRAGHILATFVGGPEDLVLSRARVHCAWQGRLAPGARIVLRSCAPEVDRWRPTLISGATAWSWLDGVDYEASLDAEGGTAKVRPVRKAADLAAAVAEVTKLRAAGTVRLSGRVLGSPGDASRVTVVAETSWFARGLQYRQVGPLGFRGCRVGGTFSLEAPLDEPFVLRVSDNAGRTVRRSLAASELTGPVDIVWPYSQQRD
jgi:hypothetical protein